MASDGAVGLRGRIKRISEIAGRFKHDDRVARQISGVQCPRRYVWSDDPPAIQLVEDATANLSEERLSAMRVFDLAVIGKKLVTDNPTRLFLIDVNG